MSGVFLRLCHFVSVVYCMIRTVFRVMCTIFSQSSALCEIARTAGAVSLYPGGMERIRPRTAGSAARRREGWPVDAVKKPYQKPEVRVIPPHTPRYAALLSALEQDSPGACRNSGHTQPQKTCKPNRK